MLAPLIKIRKLAVVQTQERENCGVRVVHVNFVFDGTQAKFVGSTNDFSSLNAPPAIHIVKPLGL